MCGAAKVGPRAGGSPVTSTRAIGGVIRVETRLVWGKEKLGVEEGGVSRAASSQ